MSEYCFACGLLLKSYNYEKSVVFKEIKNALELNILRSKEENKQFYLLPLIHFILPILLEESSNLMFKFKMFRSSTDLYLLISNILLFISLESPYELSPNVPFDFNRQSSSFAFNLDANTSITSDSRNDRLCFNFVKFSEVWLLGGYAIDFLAEIFDISLFVDALYVVIHLLLHDPRLYHLKSQLLPLVLEISFDKLKLYSTHSQEINFFVPQVLLMCCKVFNDHLSLCSIKPFQKKIDEEIWFDDETYNSYSFKESFNKMYKGSGTYLLCLLESIDKLNIIHDILKTKLLSYFCLHIFSSKNIISLIKIIVESQYFINTLMVSSSPENTSRQRLLGILCSGCKIHLTSKLNNNKINLQEDYK